MSSKILANPSPCVPMRMEPSTLNLRKVRPPGTQRLLLPSMHPAAKFPESQPSVHSAATFIRSRFIDD